MAVSRVDGEYQCHERLILARPRGIGRVRCFSSHSYKITIVKKSAKQAVPKEIEALRASMTSRLGALEEALANPGKHASLESLIRDLARVATEEADTTVRQVVRDAQRDGQSAAAAESALESEKGTVAQLRKALDKAQSELNEQRRVVDAAARDSSGAQRELDALRQSLEQEQAERASVRRELEAAHAAAEAERTRAANLEQAVEQVRGEAQASRAVVEAQQREIAAKLQEFAARHQGVDQQLKDAQSAQAAGRAEMEQARASADAERAAAAQLRESSAQLERDLEWTRGELAAARHEIDGLRGEAEARGQALSQSESEQGRLLVVAQDAARVAESRADEIILERDALKLDLDGARGELAAARQEIDSLRHDAQARSDALSQSGSDQNRLLASAQDAARAADLRAEEAARECDALRRELDLAQEAVREREFLRLELQTAHEQRDAARSMQGGPQLVVDGDEELVEETVIDLTLDSRDEERQRAIESRIRTLEVALRDAETRAEVAELELEQQRLLALPPSETPPPRVIEPEPSSEAKEPAFRGPARGAKRVAISTEVEVQIDGTEGRLIDLSVTGAQVLTPFSMKPNRLVKLTMPMGDSLIACKAKVMWSRLEPKAGQLWYRAGVSFTSADQFALEAFLSSHRKDA